MVIDPKHIQESEQLFIKGNTFDQERLDFINNLGTCDLLAVPGSGKTTALMAKLYCLSKQLPFDDGSGILVLAHTNAAVDEIEKKLKPHCPRLFEYPNFVGTIQGFVNKFLANIANFEKYGSYPTKIDDEIACKAIIEKTRSLGFESKLKYYFFFQLYSQNAIISEQMLINCLNKTKLEAKQLIRFLKTEQIIYYGSLVFNKVKNYTEISKLNLDTSVLSIIKEINNKAVEIANEQKYTRGIEYTLDFLEEKFINTRSLGFNTDAGKILLDIYEANFKAGILRYRDCYSIGFWYINHYPKVKEQLQHRLKYVFIDETQDLDKYQLDIIDSIFFTSDSKTVIQRVGDINQAIYSAGKKVKVECDWISRGTKDPQKYTDLYVTGSNRLTKSIADIVDCFTLNDQDGKFKVEGKRILPHGDIPPYLILFDKDTKGDTLKEEFGKLIKSHKLNEIEEAKNGFKIIGWVGEKEDESKLCLNSYFGYTKKQKLQRDEFDSLSEQLCLFANKGKTLKEARQSLLNALIYILKLENLKIQRTIREKKVERYYNSNELINHIKTIQGENAYDSFKRQLYEWSLNLTLKKDLEELYQLFSCFINSEFKDWFGLSLNSKVQEFIGSKYIPVQNTEVVESTEVEQHKDLGIEVATVHSVKGQTHCATMYVETDYYEYETQKLTAIKKKATKKTGEELKPNPLFKQRQNYEYTRQKEAVKMMYVGFSRPTHLLCFAALKENVETQLGCFQSAGWEIIDMTERK
ncbi:MAG TPA: UvrD-helicase domain-containing protein [Macellibacteroides fermentans]|uniref:UvrD-helicase domain-containing protein n=1 Tax=Macellibacteroides fermentans TaxID=879969 RepID=UPI002B793A4D|nr:UvrD-helicase domain-containing protein [Macellibacteroides fermentans]